jgi:hypothetical protein
MLTITAEKLTANAEKLTANVNAGLDKLEESLPTIPARVLHLQRAVANAYYERTTEFWMTVATQTKDFADTVRTGANTVTGQAKAAFADFAKTAQTGADTVAGQVRAVAADVAKNAQTGANTVVGQAAAQGRKVVQVAEKNTTKVLDTAISTVDDAVTEATDAVEGVVDTAPGSGTPYEQWTKADLLARAKEVGVEGRTTMSTRDLIAALRA